MLEGEREVLGYYLYTGTVLPHCYAPHLLPRKRGGRA